MVFFVVLGIFKEVISNMILFLWGDLVSFDCIWELGDELVVVLVEFV